ncbi:MAG: hypothetical protein H0S85_08680 [Desulfovibrionaceae bacterium]|jgi:hypothetical protein|nr:hypothetical protein [Desulfovibrionaceae bacterium]
MTTIMPQSELVRKAARYVTENLGCGKSRAALIEEAGVRYNLSPKETQMLCDFFKAADAGE